MKNLEDENQSVPENLNERGSRWLKRIDRIEENSECSTENFVGIRKMITKTHNRTGDQIRKMMK